MQKHLLDPLSGLNFHLFLVFMVSVPASRPIEEVAQYISHLLPAAITLAFNQPKPCTKVKKTNSWLIQDMAQLAQGANTLCVSTHFYQNSVDL